LPRKSPARRPTHKGKLVHFSTGYVDGPSLAAAVATYGPLPVSTVLQLAAGLAEGLGAIHAGGVVHRDLKPSNVLLANDGPRIIDFGISRAADATELTRTQAYASMWNELVTSFEPAS